MKREDAFYNGKKSIKTKFIGHENSLLGIAYIFHKSNQSKSLCKWKIMLTFEDFNQIFSLIKQLLVKNFLINSTATMKYFNQTIAMRRKKFCEKSDKNWKQFLKISRLSFLARKKKILWFHPESDYTASMTSHNIF